MRRIKKEVKIWEMKTKQIKDRDKEENRERRKHLLIEDEKH